MKTFPNNSRNPAPVELGRRGGLARAKALSAKKCKEIATKAAKAATEARRRKAKEKVNGVNVSNSNPLVVTSKLSLLRVCQSEG